MEYRPIEVKLLCAKDLKDVNVLSKMDVYVIGSVSGDPRSMQRTGVDKGGGVNPSWNHQMKFAVDESAALLNRLGLVFQIMSDRTLGDKEIGRVYVPLKELFDASLVGKEGDSNNNDVAGVERQLIYQVQTPSGKFKGQLEFSFKFGEKFTQSVDRKLDEPVMAYPAGGSVPGGVPGPSSYPGPGPGPSGGVPYGHRGGPPVYPPPPHACGNGYGYGYGYPPSQQPGPPPNPHMGYGYPGQAPGGYGYPGQAPGGYGYPGQAPGGYGYPGHGYVQQPPVAVQKPKKRFGMGSAAMGMGAGLLGGLLVGEMVEDVAEAAAYDDMAGGFDDSMF